MSFVIGDTGTFAIELASRDELCNKIGRMRIWLGGKHIGTFDDTSIYSLVWQQLDNVLAKKLDLNKFGFAGARQIYDEIKSGEIDESGRYFLSLGDSFDDFSVIALRNDDEIIVIWELLDEHFFEYEDYPLGLQCSTISVIYFSSVLSEFKALLPG